MKIVYFGSDVFLEVFNYLLQNHEIMALYTYHNDEDYFNENNIVRIAQAHCIPTHHEQISEAEMMRCIEQDGCQLFFVAEYSYILPIPYHLSFRGINLHSSLLPEGRSYYPIECAMERGLSYGGITVHKLTCELDTGDVLAQRSFPLTALDDSIDAYLYSSRAAKELVEELFSDFETFWKCASPHEKKLPYWKRPDAEALTLHHNMTLGQARETYRRFNKMTVVELNGRIFYVDGFSTGHAIIDRDSSVVFVRDNRVFYGVVDGHLRLDIHAVATN